jgi:PIN domain nuclease of toxin-antitoxin system
VVLDSHVVHWWSAEPDRISAAASKAIGAADELAVADISWFELAWLARHERIVLTIPIASWLVQLATQVRTIAVTPAIASTAVSLPSSFPGDPADRFDLRDGDRKRLAVGNQGPEAAGAPPPPSGGRLVGRLARPG